MYAIIRRRHDRNPPRSSWGQLSLMPHSRLVLNEAVESSMLLLATCRLLLVPLNRADYDTVANSTRSFNPARQCYCVPFLVVWISALQR